MVVAGRSAMTPRTLVRGQEAATSHRRPRTICQATADARNMEDTFTARAVSMLFKFPPLWEAARKKARQTIVDRAEAIGVDWHGQMRRLSAVDWEAEMAAVRDPALAMPDYYTKPFHAYPSGNLSWDAALEVETAARSVHATVFSTGAGEPELDPEGDARLRGGFSDATTAILKELGAREPQDVVDLGCATGLSSLELRRAFPGCRVTGVDLSAHFLAVGAYLLREEPARGGPDAIRFVHAPAEATGLPGGSFDMVSMCLTAHELPQAATQAICREALRLLRPGGVFAIMDMDPEAPEFRRILDNVFAYTAFRSTEPWLGDYATLDVHASLRDAGFARTMQRACSPKHRAIVGIKDAA